MWLLLWIRLFTGRPGCSCFNFSLSLSSFLLALSLSLCFFTLPFLLLPCCFRFYTLLSLVPSPPSPLLFSTSSAVIFTSGSRETEKKKKEKRKGWSWSFLSTIFTSLFIFPSLSFFSFRVTWTQESESSSSSTEKKSHKSQVYYILVIETIILHHQFKLDVIGMSSMLPFSSPIVKRLLGWKKGVRSTWECCVLFDNNVSSTRREKISGPRRLSSLWLRN